MCAHVRALSVWSRVHAFVRGSVHADYVSWRPREVGRGGGFVLRDAAHVRVWVSAVRARDAPRS